MSKRDKPTKRELLEKASDSRSFDLGSREATSQRRRSVLHGSLGFFGSVLGLSESASAKDDKTKQRVREITNRYDSVADAQAILDDQGGPVVAALRRVEPSSGSAVANPSVEKLQVNQGPSEKNPDEATYLAVYEQDGTFTAHISFVRKTPNRIIKLIVQPELDRAYSLILTREGELVTIVDPESPRRNKSGSTDDVSTQDCEFDRYVCSSSCCLLYLCKRTVKKKRYCCRGVADGCYQEATDTCCDPLYY